MANLSYFDANGELKFIDGADLPWSEEFPVTAATGIGSIAAQSNSSSISCRIALDGVVKAEKTTDGVNAFTYCMLKAT